MSAHEALKLAQAVGIEIELHGDDLVLEASTAPPFAVLDALTHNKKGIIELLRPATDVSQAEDWYVDFDERAAIIEYGAGVPREWAEGFARFCTMPRHPDFSEQRWQCLIDDAGRFLDRWAVQVAAMGWTTLEVFGVHSGKPDVRIDLKGLVPCIGGREVIAVSADSATIQTPSGARQRIFKRLEKQSLGRIPVWEVRHEN
jgi:hypothetical protein